VSRKPECRRVPTDRTRSVRILGNAPDKTPVQYNPFTLAECIPALQMANGRFHKIPSEVTTAPNDFVIRPIRLGVLQHLVAISLRRAPQSVTAFKLPLPVAPQPCLVKQALSCGTALTPNCEIRWLLRRPDGTEPPTSHSRKSTTSGSLYPRWEKRLNGCSNSAQAAVGEWDRSRSKASHWS
jgi:hypothetical protein